MTVMTEFAQVRDLQAGQTIRVHTLPDDEGVVWTATDRGSLRSERNGVELLPRAFRSAVGANLVELIEDEQSNVPTVDIADIQRMARETRDRELHDSLVETVGDSETIDRDELWEWMENVGLGRPVEEVTASFEISGSTDITMIADPDEINSSWNQYDLRFEPEPGMTTVYWTMEIDEVTIPRTSSDSCEDVDEDFIENWLEDSGIEFNSGTIGFERRRCSQCT